MVRRAPRTDVWPRVGAGVASVAIAISLAGCQFTKAAAPDSELDLASKMQIDGALSGQKQTETTSEAASRADELAQSLKAAQDEARQASADAKNAEERAAAAEEEAAAARAAQAEAEAAKAKAESILADKRKLEETFPSWNPDSESLKKLVAFVRDATDEANENFVPVADRVATFDVDGTILCEKAPFYADYCLLIHRVLDDDTYTADTVMRELCEGLRNNPMEVFADSNTDREKNLDIAFAFRDMTPQEFRDYAEDFLDTVEVVGFSGMTYGESVYQPMVEVVKFLQQNDFNIYIVTAGERDFARALAKSRFDIPYDHVIGVDNNIVSSKQGSVPASEYNMGQDEKVTYGGRQSEPRGKMGKVVMMEQEIGIRPILAFGNSTGDFSMLNYAQSNPTYKGMGVLVVCDDAKREYGDADKAADYMKSVTKEGWLPFSMRNDWKNIYKEGVTKTSITAQSAEPAKEEAAEEKAEAAAEESEQTSAEPRVEANADSSAESGADATAASDAKADEATEAGRGAETNAAAKADGTTTENKQEGAAEHNEEDATETADGSQTNGSTNASEMRVKGTVNLDNAQAA